MEKLLLGTIIGTHGLTGSVKFISYSYFLDKRLQNGKSVYIGKSEADVQEYEVESFKQSPKFSILKLKEINVIEEADKLKNNYIFVNKQDLILDNDTYYFQDLEKCKVIDEKNNLLGHVIKVEEFPAQITLRVKKLDGKEFFVPFIDQFILKVDIKNSLIQIMVIGGML